jgi:hypothetical protein
MFGYHDDFVELCFPTPTGSMPDEMLPLLNTKHEDCLVTPNLDILLSKYLNNDELNDI